MIDVTKGAVGVLSTALTLAFSSSVVAQSPQLIPVGVLAGAPTVDGDLADWPTTGWTRVKVAPAVPKGEREQHGLDPEDRNLTGSLVVELRAGVFEGQVYVAARWPDDAADVDYKGWEWLGGKYVPGKRRDDGFALRFHLSGDFDRSMMSAKTYAVDLWNWSAARTNPLGYAEDWTHQLSTRPIDDAAEYEVKGVGTVYIKKIRDAGSGIYKMLPRPKTNVGARVSSFEFVKSPTGSVADVVAKGRWGRGQWALEMGRLLNTGHADDIVLGSSRVLGQIAVFNRGSDENKSVSEPLWFDFSAQGD